jgi:hypothetical protein
LEGLAMADVVIFYGHSVYFTAMYLVYFLTFGIGIYGYIVAKLFPAVLSILLKSRVFTPEGE